MDLYSRPSALLGEEIFDVAEAEGEPVVEPDGVANSRGRERGYRVTPSGIQLMCPRLPEVE